MNSYRVVETDNFGRDYPDEKWACPYFFSNAMDAAKIADAFNRVFCDDKSSPRYWKVVEDGYVLQPGFEP